MKTAFSKADIESELAGRFGSAFKLHEKPPALVLSTGVPEVDVLTGGFPRGAITEIFGPASSGRTSFMISTLAYATRHEEICALIDTNDVFDPRSANEAGVNLDQLFWICCGTKMEHAFKATDLLLQGGGFGLVVLDIGDVPPRDAQRIISSWWYRFRRTLENTPTVLVVIAEDSCVRSCASLALKMRREANVWSSITGPNSVIFTPRSLANQKLTKSPSHSRLLSSLHFQIARQKPVYLGSSETQFYAEASK